MADDNNIDTGTPDAGSPGEPSTLRDDIASAFDAVESRDSPTGAPTPGAPALAGTEAPPSAPKDSGGRVRGPDGKFIAASEAPPAPAAKPAAAPGAPQAAPTAKQPLAVPGKPPEGAKPPDPAAAVAPLLKPPVSWKPGAREHWAKLPPEVQQEVARRESETARTLQESHQARQALQHVQGIIGPFAQNIAAAGGDALSVMGELFKADNTLRHGSTAEKASMAASIIKSYGIDIGTLDSILAGQTPQADPNQALADRLRQEMQAQLKPVMGYLHQVQGARQSAMQQIDQQAQSELESFQTDGAHEFFEDVRQDMADIIDLFTQRGHSITLQDAYDRAIRINPQVSDTMSKRAEAERVNAAAAAAQRARRTAASVSGSAAPAGAGPGPAGDDRRAQIEQAWDQASGG